MNTFRAIVIPVEGDPALAVLNGYEGIKENLDGGWLEALPIRDDIVAYIDEEGKLKNLSFNPIATQICTKMQIGLSPDDVIVGPMVLCGTKQSGDPEEGMIDCDLPRDFILSLFKLESDEDDETTG